MKLFSPSAFACCVVLNCKCLLLRNEFNLLSSFKKCLCSFCSALQLSTSPVLVKLLRASSEARAFFMGGVSSRVTSDVSLKSYLLTPALI